MEQQDSSVMAEAAADFRRPRISPFAVLIAITTALLCALMPLNTPTASAAGSAFNPANSFVTLNAPASARAVIKRLVQGNGPDGFKPLIADHDAIAVAAVAFAFPRAAEPVSFEPADRVDGLPAAPISAAWPRGPPQA